ncbi:MAG: TROVE domain-containing protein [Geminicoccaceae bacterium]
MAKLNVKPTYNHVTTHEGAPAYPHLSAEQQLRRSVLACLLWEDQFYEDGQAIAERITKTAEQCAPAMVADLAKEARGKFNLRHAPLLLLDVLTRTGSGSHLVSDTIADTIQRADELSELLAIYWRGGKRPLSAQLKQGLARALTKFDAYQLAKYDRAGQVRLRDVLFMVHAKPENEDQGAMWRQLVDGTLPAPDTWEVGLSAGGDKKETFERLLTERKLGYLALLRNLRNMDAAGVDDGLIRGAIMERKGAKRVFPFRYVAAAKAMPRFEPELDSSLKTAVAEMERLPGQTFVLVDVSASMNWDNVSKHSDMTRMHVAAALAAVVPYERKRVFTFSDNVVEVPPRDGMACVDAVLNSQQHSGTYLGGALGKIMPIKHDRLIVITDEQSHDRVPDPVADKSYMINVASSKNGVGYGKWRHIDGFSEQVIRWIQEYERLDADRPQ